MNFKRLTAMAMAVATAFSVNAFAADKTVSNINTAQTSKTTDGKTAKTVTYDEAVKLAIKNTSSIATIDEAMDYMENSKEAISTNLSGYYPYSGTSQTVETAIGTLLSSIGTIDGNSKAYRYQKQMLEETAELMVKNYFDTIKTSENALALAKDSLRLKQDEYSQLVLKNKLGMISNNDLKNASNALTKMKENVKMAELAIDSVYSSLGNTIGLKAGTDFDIDYTLEYKPFEMEIGLDSYITQKSSTDPSVQVAKANLETAEFQKKVSTYETEPYSYQQKDNAVNSADRTWGDTVKNLKTAISNAYNSIGQLESNRTALEAALADAKTTYATAQTNYQVGNITKLQLEQAELAVKSAENDLISNASSHDLLVFQFEHPYMLSNSNSSSSQQ